MRRSALLTGTLAGVLFAAPAFGQAASASTILNGKAFQVTPYAGYMMFGKMIDGPLGTSLGSAGGPLYGAQLGMKVAPNVTVIGNVAYTSGDLEVGIPIIGGISVGQSKALLADGGLQLDLPTGLAGGALAPFVQAGVGVMRYDIELGGSLVGGTLFETKATNFAGNVGAGADFSLGRSAALRVIAKDYIGKFDFKEAAYFDFGGKTMHNWALSAGIRLDF